MEKSKSKVRPNLLVMICGMVILTVTGMVIFDDDGLPLAAAAVGSLGTLGLALMRPEDDPQVEKLQDQLDIAEVNFSTIVSDQKIEIQRLNNKLDSVGITLPSEVLMELLKDRVLEVSTVEERIEPELPGVPSA